MGLEPEYLMLSLWLFFLLIDGFTKVIFSLSSTYGPGLPNDVFVPGRAWSLFVLTAVPREGVWAPHVRGCGEQRSSTQSWKQRHGGAGGRPRCAKPGDPRTEERPRRDAVTSAECPFAFKSQPCVPDPAAGTFSPGKGKKKMIVRVIMAETDQRRLYVSTSSFCKKKAKGEECVFDLLKAVWVCGGREYSCFLLIHPNSISQQPPQCSLSISNLPVQSQFLLPPPAPQLLFLGASYPRLWQLCSVRPQTKASVLGSSPSLQLPIQSVIKSWLRDLWHSPGTDHCSQSLLLHHPGLCQHPLWQVFCPQTLLLPSWTPPKSHPHAADKITLPKAKSGPVSALLRIFLLLPSLSERNPKSSPWPQGLLYLTASRWPTSSLLSVCDSFQLRSNLGAVKCTDLIAQQSFPYVYVQATTIQIKIWNISINPESSLISLYS